MNIFLIILGSSTLSILLDRIHESLLFIKDRNEVTLFLTGGVKNIICESDIMMEKIWTEEKKRYDRNWKYIIDVNASAEKGDYEMGQ